MELGAHNYYSEVYLTHVHIMLQLVKQITATGVVSIIYASHKHNKLITGNSKARTTGNNKTM